MGSQNTLQHNLNSHLRLVVLLLVLFLLANQNLCWLRHLYVISHFISPADQFIQLYNILMWKIFMVVELKCNLLENICCYMIVLCGQILFAQGHYYYFTGEVSQLPINPWKPWNFITSSTLQYMVSLGVLSSTLVLYHYANASLVYWHLSSKVLILKP